MAAERQLQRERALVVVALVGEEPVEQLLAGGCDAVRLARPEAGARAPADSGRREVATKERDDSHGRLGLQHETRIALALRQVGELLGQRASGVQPGLGVM